MNEYFTPEIFFSPPHLEHIASSGVKTDPGLRGLNATLGLDHQIYQNKIFYTVPFISYFIKQKTQIPEVKSVIEQGCSSGFCKCPKKKIFFIF